MNSYSNTIIIDKEITFNCLDILTNLGKHIVLKDTSFGTDLIKSLFDCVKKTSMEVVLDQTME